MVQVGTTLHVIRWIPNVANCVLLRCNQIIIIFKQKNLDISDFKLSSLTIMWDVPLK
jgi:hypothetical protein